MTRDIARRRRLRRAAPLLALAGALALGGCAGDGYGYGSGPYAGGGSYGGAYGGYAGYDDGWPAYAGMTASIIPAPATSLMIVAGFAAAGTAPPAMVGRDGPEA